MNTAVQNYHVEQSANRSQHRSSDAERKIPAGWWILPAVFGGAAMWVKLFMYVLG